MKKSLIFLILILSLTVKCLFADSVVVADAQVKELPDEQFQLCIRSTGPQPFDVIEAETKDVEILLYQASLGEVDAIITAAFGSIEFREKPEGRVWVGIDFSGNKFAAKVSQGVDGQSVDVRVFVSTDEQGPVISDLKSVNVTSAGALIAWMTDEPSDGTVVIELNGEVVANIAEKNVPATEHSVLVESLEAETVYSYYVISEDGQGNRSESSRGAFETQASTDLLSDLVSYLKFDSLDGNFADDSSPKSNSGRLNGNPMISLDRPYTSELNTHSIKLDGMDDYINITNSADINLGVHQHRSISLWFKVNDKSVSTHKQVLYEEGGVGRGLNIYIHNGLLYVGGWNAVAAESNWSGTFLKTNSFSSDHWHHVVVTLKGSNSVQPDSFVGYLDGVEFGRGPGSQLWEHIGLIGVGAVNHQTKFHDEKTSIQNGHYLTGSVDELRIYNRVLTDADINALSRLEPDITPPVISNIQAEQTQDSIVVSWSTNELTTGRVAYGEALDSVNAVEQSASSNINHSVMLKDLTPDTPYFFEVTSVDASGNSTQSDKISVRTNSLPAADITSKLVAYYDFESNNANTVNDESGSNNPLNLSGGLSLAEESPSTSFSNAKSLTFDGVNDYASITNSGDINLGIHKERSISLWFKADNVNITGRKQVLYEEGGVGRGLNIYVYGGQLYVGGWNIVSSESDWSGTFLQTSVIQSNYWHHVVLTLQGGPVKQGDALKAYLDGVEFGRGQGSQLWEHIGLIGIGAVNNQTKFHDGATSIDKGHFLVGFIDELRIYNRALNTEEINALR